MVSKVTPSNAVHVNGSLFGLAPSGVYLADMLPRVRCALPHPFTLTDKPKFGGLLSAALSVGSRPRLSALRPAEPGLSSCLSKTSQRLSG